MEIEKETDELVKKTKNTVLSKIKTNIRFIFNRDLKSVEWCLKKKLANLIWEQTNYTIGDPRDKADWKIAEEFITEDHILKVRELLKNDKIDCKLIDYDIFETVCGWYVWSEIWGKMKYLVGCDKNFKDHKLKIPLVQP